MSNLSNVGFSVADKPALHQLLHQTVNLGRAIGCPQGEYRCLADASGAELYTQLVGGEIVGMNPHFEGPSRRVVCLTAALPDDTHELDGGFHAWAAPDQPHDPKSGLYPFVFDVPDFRVAEATVPALPQSWVVQLAAFADAEFAVYDDEGQYDQAQTGEFKYAPQSFIPLGLFGTGPGRPGAYGQFAGIIRDWELRTNHHTGESFYWLLVDTLGGEVDVVADPRLLARPPRPGGIAAGSFWLSARLLEPVRATG